MNVADANGLLMFVAMFVLWPQKKDNKMFFVFTVCLSNSEVSTSLPRLSLV